MFDGVLASFDVGFTRLLIQMTKRDAFLPFTPERGPRAWDWFYHDGYTREEVEKAWAEINRQSNWWMRLAPLSGASTLAMTIVDLERHHDIYFITSRASTPNAKAQTELWLQSYIGLPRPTVLISSQKGLAAQALMLDAYIDDNVDNVLDVAGVAKAYNAERKVFLLDKDYNQGALTPNVTRVRSVGQMLDYLVLNL